jgi:hypothetical protein
MRLKNIVIAFVVFAMFAAIPLNSQDVTKLRVVYKIPYMDKVQVQRGITYKASDQTKWVRLIR